MTPKLYTTTTPVPSGDVVHAVHADASSRHHGAGMYRTYVLADSKRAAAEAIGDAYRGIALDPKYLRIVGRGDKHAEALRQAGLFDNAGDVVTTDRNHGLGVSLVRMAPEADGDPQRVGEWGSEKDADDFPVEFFQPVNGDKITMEEDPILRRVLLEQRAEEERATAIDKAAERATERVAEFLDVRSLMDGTNPKVIYTVGADGRRAELTTTDLIDLIEYYREKSQ